MAHEILINHRSVRPVSRRVWRLTFIGLPTLGVGLALTLVAFAISGPLIGGVAFIGYCALLFLGFIFYRPSRILLAFLWLLPTYQLSLVLLFHFTSSNRIISLVQPWKECLAAVGLIIAISYQVVSVQKLRLKRLDRLMLAYFVLLCIYLILPLGNSFVERLYGFRSLTFLVVLYFIGKGVPLSVYRQKQVLWSLLLLGILTGIATLIDHFVLPIDWPSRIGLSQYLGRISNFTQDFTVIGPLDLPWTYWTATMQRRASAFYANPLDLAASIHLTGIAALVLATQSRRTWRGLLAWSAFGGAFVALLLSISRMSIIIFAFECLLTTRLLRKKRLTALILLCMFVGFIMLLLTGFSAFIIETILLQNPSVVGHLLKWEEGVWAIISSPLGLGLGTSGLVGMRFGTSVGGENQYVTIGVQTGVLGMLLYLAIQIMAIRTALKVFRQSSGPTKWLALVTGVSRLGIAVVAFTADLETYVFSAYISWWLIGWVSQIPTQKHTVLRSAQSKPIQKEL